MFLITTADKRFWKTDEPVFWRIRKKIEDNVYRVKNENPIGSL